MPKEDFDVRTEAILPPSVESLRHGKKLRKFLHRRKSASVKVIGTFEYSGHPYGPEGTPFRFVISEITSVEKAPYGPASARGVSHEAGPTQGPSAP
jgi:Flp pilus assembly CpaE family ATPase